MFVLSSPLSWAQSDQLQVLKDKKAFAIKSITAGYLAELEILLVVLTNAKDANGALEVEKEIARTEEGLIKPIGLPRKFTENYLIGTKWKYGNGRKKYMLVFERRTYKIYEIDKRGRKFLQKQKEWRIENLEDRRISTSRGTEAMTLSQDLARMSVGSWTAYLDKK